MKSAIILLLVLCIGCKHDPKFEPKPGQSKYPEAEKALNNDGKKHDTIVNGVIFAPNEWRIDEHGNFIVDSAVMAQMQQDYADTHHTQRFFLVGYTTMLKEKHDPIIGYMSIEAGNGFFNKRAIDSIVHAGLVYRKECYQDIVITSVYEFKSRSDYNDFGHGWGEADAKKQKECCNIDFHLGGPVIDFGSDTSGTFPQSAINFYDDNGAVKEPHPMGDTSMMNWEYGNGRLFFGNSHSNDRGGVFTGHLLFYNDTPREKEPRVDPEPGLYFGDPPWDTAHFGGDSSLTFDTPLSIGTIERAEKDSSFIFRRPTLYVFEPPYTLLHRWIIGLLFPADKDSLFMSFNRKLDSLGLNNGRYESYFIESSTKYWGKGKEERQ